MKKLFSSIFLLIAVFIFISSASAENLPVPQKEGEAIIIAKTNISAMQTRKSHRVSLRVGLINPTDNINLNKDSTYDFELQFDAKLNENFDSGPRIGYVSKKFKSGATDATYGILKFGFGSRVYFFYWGDYGSTHGFFNAYASGDFYYYTASKTTESLATSPGSFAGIGLAGVFGLELAFGPNATGFVEAAYQKTQIKSSTNEELPLDGVVYALGVRMTPN